MSINKVEMSLDEIIKANRKKDNANRTSGKKVSRSTIAKRKPAFNGKKSAGSVQKRGRVTSAQGRKNANSNRFKKNAPRNVKTTKSFRSKNQANAKVNTVATKRLVQNLVKKALAQRNFRTKNNRITAMPVSLRRRGGVRLVKKTVVLNRVSPKSRVINQRRRVVPVMTVKQQRMPIRFDTIPQAVQIVPQRVARRNYVPVQQRKFVDRRPVVVHQPRMAHPGYQLVQVPLGRQNRGAGTVRQQINAMRRQTVYVKPQEPRRAQSQFRQQSVTYVQDQRPQQRRRFQDRRRQNKQSSSHFFEPQNFLQRIPVQKQSRR